ncbi:MAG: alpha-acetolactate decarboxylase [Pedobacter sp.]|nr:MAG: alpha-acetolactate decarboxylase [Pedobacter sp.]
MSNVMKKGQLQGTISLDTIADKKNLYGLGPKEFLKGELLILDGISYVSSINPDQTIKIEKNYDAKAPFFVYANNNSWKEITLPKNILTLEDLERFIDENSKQIIRPFVFKLKGNFSKVNFHIQNLPDGSVVKSPKDAHQGQGKFERTHVNGELIGFFSTQHQTIFTHHDTFLHIHYIDEKRTEMGHLDNLLLDGTSEIKLYLPIN